MPPTATKARHLDEREWSVATKSSPLVIQVILGVALAASWAFGRWTPLGDNFTQPPHSAVIGAVSLTVVVAFVIAAVLLRQSSATARGIGLSTAACAAVALIGAIPYAIWLL